MQKNVLSDLNNVSQTIMAETSIFMWSNTALKKIINVLK